MCYVKVMFRLFCPSLKTASLGFTLVEIIVAIAILSLAAVVAIPGFNKFNQDQVLSLATGELITTLRQAEGNAQSGVKCGDNNGSPSINWYISFSSFNDYYELKATCQTDPILTIYSKKKVTPDSITVSTICSDGSTPTTGDFITFNSTTYPSSPPVYPCVAPAIFMIKLTSLKSNKSDYVRVDQGGAIYETQSTPGS
ncbi:prepilin-type N-terminal cleavage/methylation domain-containing protein [Candidatus Daviesbacteria bacterium]|nr:prepilin-type N-terminal cleavage/methylation domain-containing protein [Candidatus Daviesbacteria bacterium]